MARGQRFWQWFLPAAVVFAAGFVVATLWDLPIDQAIYSPHNLFAILMECFGWYPAFLPTLLLALLLCMPEKSQHRHMWQCTLAGLVAFLGFAALYYSSFSSMVHRGLLSGGSDGKIWFWLAGGLVLAGVMVWGVWKSRKDIRRKLTVFALWGSVYMTANQAVVYLLKTLWQRTRFDDMLAAGSFADFTPWFRPLGNGGSSFPSGHTANAAGIFVLIILCDLFITWNKKRKLIYGVCWGYIALMAFARVLIGRHFLSDTLAAAALMAVLFWAMRTIKPYRCTLRDARIDTTENATPSRKTPEAS